MEALFETTIQKLVEETTNRISELRDDIDTMRSCTLRAARGCMTYRDLRLVMVNHKESNLDIKLSQYIENLEYLKSCPYDKVVILNQTEWRHYFRGEPRPELC